MKEHNKHLHLVVNVDLRLILGTLMGTFSLANITVEGVFSASFKLHPTTAGFLSVNRKVVSAAQGAFQFWLERRCHGALLLPEWKLMVRSQNSKAIFKRNMGRV